MFYHRMGTVRPMMDKSLYCNRRRGLNMLALILHSSDFERDCSMSFLNKTDLYSKCGCQDEYNFYANMKYDNIENPCTIQIQTVADDRKMGTVASVYFSFYTIYMSALCTLFLWLQIIATNMSV